MNREGLVRQFDSGNGRSSERSWRVETSYFDARGTERQVPNATIGALKEVLEPQHAPTYSPSRVIAVRPGEIPKIATGGAQDSGAWRLLHNHQPIASGQASGGEIELNTPLAIGSYTLEFANHERVLIVSAPRESYQPAFFRDGGRAWLLAVQLYGVRSERNLGHGDFTDLAQLLRIAARAGAAGVGVNPLHALATGQSSPYSPSSRIFLNSLYIDIDAIPELGSIGASPFADEVTRLRAAELVDYLSVHRIKLRMLRTAYAVFSSKTTAPRRAAFDTFLAQGGESLKLFCAYEHLRERFDAGWQAWPAEWHDASAAAAKLDPAEIEFHAYIQWIAHEQLSACRDLAQELGLPIGLYLDIAVGVDAGGADAWAAPDVVSSKLSIGAPPDIYNPAGQNWGLAAPNPQAQIDTDFALYRQVMRAAMRYAGAIRIDHALGLNRFFLVPNGSSAADGGYVSFPFDALLAVTAQESVANRCLVIGEDLGTIPEGVSEKLNHWGVWSYRVALFERENEDRFRLPENFPNRAIVTFNTHDLPTFAGWVESHDLKTKSDLSIDPGETADERQQTQKALANTLVAHGMKEHLSFTSVLRYLARTHSQLLSVGIEDVLGLKDQANIPGTVDEHPNWRRRLPVSLETLGDLPELHRIATVLAEEGRGFAHSG